MVLVGSLDSLSSQRHGAKTRSGEPCMSPAVSGKSDVECTVARQGQALPVEIGMH